VTYVSYAIELTLGATFLVSGVGKFRRLPKFERALAAYELLPHLTVRPLSRVVPCLETVVGLCLLAGAAETAALWAASSLLLLFAAGMAVNVLRGRRIDCGCTSKSGPVSWPLVARNVTVAALAAASVVSVSPASGLRELSGTGNANPGLAGAITAALFLVVVEFRVVSSAVALYRLVRRRDLPVVFGLAS
jgi:uncharacterized membrane protein